MMSSSLTVRAESRSRFGGASRLFCACCGRTGLYTRRCRSRFFRGTYCCPSATSTASATPSF